MESAKEEKLEVIVYILIDPRDQKIRYVGITRMLLKERWKGHLSDHKGESRKCCWIKRLRSLKIRPIIKQIDSCNIESCAEKEGYWITRLTEEGHELYNHMGMEGYLPVDATREQIRAAKKGKKPTEEQKFKSRQGVIAFWENPDPESQQAVRTAWKKAAIKKLTEQEISEGKIEDETFLKQIFKERVVSVCSKKSWEKRKQNPEVIKKIYADRTARETPEYKAQRIANTTAAQPRIIAARLEKWNAKTEEEKAEFKLRMKEINRQNWKKRRAANEVSNWELFGYKDEWFRKIPTPRLLERIDKICKSSKPKRTAFKEGETLRICRQCKEAKPQKAYGSQSKTKCRDCISAWYYSCARKS